MSDILLFDATFNDIPHIRIVQKIVWLATYPNTDYDITEEDIRSSFTSDSDSKYISAVQKALTNNINFHGWIAKEKEYIVGYCFGEKNENKNHIYSLYVLPKYQGQGVGKRLFLKALKWLGNTSPAVLEVASYNAKAIAFYKSFGFVENGPTHNKAAVLTINKSIPEIEMIKKS